MALGGEVEDGFVARQHPPKGLDVADVGVHEPVPALVGTLDVLQRRPAAGVGQGVVHRDLVVGVGEDPAQVVGADEARAAGDEKPHGPRGY